MGEIRLKTVALTLGEVVGSKAHKKTAAAAGSIELWRSEAQRQRLI